MKNKKSQMIRLIPEKLVVWAILIGLFIVMIGAYFLWRNSTLEIFRGFF